MSDEFERPAGEKAILSTAPSALIEQAATYAVLEDLRHDSEKAAEATAELGRDLRPFSWDVDPQELAKALSTAAALPWVIWSTGMSLAYSMWLTPIDIFGSRAPETR
jgi:hypothetical protein